MSQLLEESALDEELCSTLREVSGSPSPHTEPASGPESESGRAMLGSSLSSDFFKNLRKKKEAAGGAQVLLLLAILPILLSFGDG